MATAALNNYRFAYLVTVDDEYRVHTATVEPELRDASWGQAPCALRQRAW